jgi:hypothetical protein
MTSNNWLAVGLLALIGVTAYIIVRRPPSTPEDFEDIDW